MSKKVRLTESDLKSVIYETVMKRIKMNESEEGIAGFDSNSIDYGGMKRDGSIESVCGDKFTTAEDLKSFLEELGQVLDMEDVMDSINMRIDEFIDEEGKVTGW